MSVTLDDVLRPLRRGKAKATGEWLGFYQTLDDVICRLDATHCARIAELEAEVSHLRALLGTAGEALILAEDVLSRRPYSAEIWPNGTHPAIGIEQIRAALAAIREESEKGDDNV